MRLERARDGGTEGIGAGSDEPRHWPWLGEQKDLAAADAEDLAGDVLCLRTREPGDQLADGAGGHFERALLVGGLGGIGGLDGLGDTGCGEN